MSVPFQDPSSHQMRQSNKPSAAKIPLRTMRKKDKTTGEVIWTHQLEACLVEALRAFDHEKEAESPCRCKYVSNYIYKKTGISRTSTQISSRIQQMYRGADSDLLKVLHKGKRKTPTRKNFFRVDSVSLAPNPSDQAIFINYPIQENSPASTASTSETSDVDHGTPLQQSTQLGNWTTQDTEYYYPNTIPSVETSTGQYSTANPPSEPDFEYINMLTAMDVSNINQLYPYPHGYYYSVMATTGQSMQSSYGDHPGVPSMQPAIPYYVEENFNYQSYQNQQTVMPYQYFDGSGPSGTGQITYGVDGSFTQYGDEHRGAHHTG